jgi:hypothetical protein
MVLRDGIFWDKSPREAIARSLMRRPIPISPDLPLVVQGIPREKAIFINFEECSAQARFS